MIKLNRNSLLAVIFIFAPFVLRAQEVAPSAAGVNVANSSQNAAPGAVGVADSGAAGDSVANSTNEVAPDSVANSTQNAKSWDFFFTLGPSVYVNTGSKKTSAPSPVSFTPGIGFDFFKDRKIGLQTALSFFSTYNLWDGKNARPAEVENREANTINFMLDINGTKKFTFNKNIFEVSAGAGFLIRYGFLANGVNDDEAGTSSGKTVKDDIGSINDWYYTGMNFLYPNVGFCWLHDFEGKWNGGLFLKYYVPLGALMDDRGMDTSIIALGVKILRE